MSTAQGIVQNSLKEIGVLSSGETLSAADATDGFARLNRFLDSLAADNLTIYSVTRTTATLTASQASFTVGPSGNINIVRPVFVEKVNFIDTSTDPDTEYPLPPLLSEQDYQAITLKALTSPFPQAAYYNPTFPTGTLIPWPIPTSSTLLWAFYAWTALPQFAALSTTVSLPPGYEEMLTQNLALMQCPSYGAQPHPVLVRSASDSMAKIKRANTRTRELSFGSDVPGVRSGGSWSIYTGP